MRLSLPAFRSRNYRLFFMGQGVSLIGTWMTQIATIWLVYHLTQSPFLLGLVGFASQIPAFFLTPFGGVVGDRWHRRKVLVVTQILSMIQSLALAVLTFSGAVQIWQIMLLALFQGVVNAVDAPTRQAFVSEMVERREDLPNAIALNSSMFNGARLVGPAVAGVIIAAVGAGYCFLIDGLSYIAVIASLLAMQVKARSNSANQVTSLNDLLHRLAEGFRYAYNFVPMRSILMLLALVSFMGMQYVVLLPIFATEILKGNAETLGILTAAAGVGALFAGTFLSLRQNVVGLGRFIAIAPTVLGCGLILFAFSRTLWLSTAAMMLVGFGFLLQFASSNTVIQTLVEDDKRGRVMSLYIMSFMGMVPLGNLFGGTLASWIGAPTTLVIDGVFCILGSMLFLRHLPKLRQVVRPIYRSMGILPAAKT
ncbi:MAG TPA: MFS transporter [Trichocoleus sp.]|jgi:MFS family permease